MTLEQKFWKEEGYDQSDCNYQNQSHFCTRFIQSYKAKPTEWIYTYAQPTMAGTNLKMLRNQNLGDEDDEFEGDGNNNLQQW